MLVTSRGTGRWIIPKGWPMKRKAPHAAAAREALEEAGVVGQIDKQPIGSFSHEKLLKKGETIVCDVQVFALEVTHQRKTWREKLADSKDLRIELRSFESMPAMALFSVTTFVLFHFGLHKDSVSGDLASGVLWVTLLFAAVLGINRLFVADAEQGGFEGFLLSPADRSALLFAKALRMAPPPAAAPPPPPATEP